MGDRNYELKVWSEDPELAERMGFKAPTASERLSPDFDTVATAVSAPGWEVQETLPRFLHRAARNKERFVICERNKPVAALVPIEDLNLLEEIEDRRDAEEGRAALEDWERSGRKTTSIEDVVRRLGIKE